MDIPMRNINFTTPLTEQYVDWPISKNVSSPSFGFGDLWNTLANRQNTSVGDWFGGVGQATGSLAKQGLGATGSLAKTGLSFLGGGNIASGLIGGTLGAITSWQAAQAQNRALRGAIKGQEKARDNFMNMQTDNINRGMGVSNDLLNRFAINNNPNKDQMYFGAYGQNVSSTNQNNTALGQQIAEANRNISTLKGQKLSNGQIAMNTIGGIFSGGQTIGNMATQNKSSQMAGNIYEEMYKRIQSDPNFFQNLLSRSTQ